ncbi:MAG TPA: choice-of-anchor tandem repeat GloVer-containing protein [Tepidisphaeraceae bacterium]|jgi:hypothetical protein
MLSRRNVRRVCQVAVESIESRILFSASLTTLANFGTYDVAQGGVVVDSRGDIFGTTMATSSTYGSLWEIPAGENTIQYLVNFTGNNGSDPGSFLTIDSTGDVFGTTAGGGAYGDGEVWELPASSTNITRLASYNGIDGPSLGNGLDRDLSGNIYVIAEGGSSTGGAILELPSGSSSFTVLGTFASGSDPIGRPVIDLAGNIYATTAEGGTNGVGAIDELTADRQSFNTLVSFNANDSTPQGDLLIDSAGDVFGTTVNTNQNVTVSTAFEIPGDSTIINTLANETSTTGSYIEPGLVRDSSGNIFGSTTGAYGQQSTVFEVPISGNAYGQSQTLVSIPEYDNSGVNTNAATGFLFVDSEGNLYGTTQSTSNNNNDTVFEIAGAGAAEVGSQLVITQQPTQTIVQNEITPAITADVLDSNDNLVADDTSPISVRIATGPNGAFLGGSLSVDAVDGVATFSNLNLNTTGSYTLTFSGPNLSSATSSNFRIIPSPLDGSHLVFTLPPAVSTTAGVKLQEFIVTAEQPSDAVSTKTKGTVTLTINDGPTGGKIMGSKTAPLQKGVAIFKKVSFNVAGTYTLEATDIASTAATPVEFNIVATTPKKMVFATQPAAKIAAQTPFQVSVELKDKYGNIATDDESSITIALSSKNAVFQGNTIGDVVDGIATFDDLTILDPGHYTLEATDASERLKATSKGFKITS